MSVVYDCPACGVTVEAGDVEGFGYAYLVHVRSDHADWPYPDLAVRNYGEALNRLTGSTARLAAIGDVEVHPVTEDRIDDWLAFFDHDAFAGKPEWAACYCSEPHLLARGTPPDQAEHHHWTERRQIMVDLLRTGRSFGYVAYVDGRPAGWVNASRRSEQALYCLGERADVADEAVAAVSCFAIAPPYRRHGLAGRLLDAVVAGAPAQGVEWIEAYPFHEGVSEEGGTNFHGDRSLFEQRDFEPVKELTHYTVMRRAVPRP